MRGLLRKDWELIALNKRFLIVVLLMALFITSTGTDATFIQTYLAFMALFMVLNSISYDEMDNGMAYLMSLPVSRKTYVKEKYLLISICVGAVSVFGSILAFFINSAKSSPVTIEELGLSFLVSLISTLIFSAILLPMVIKFGPDKGRIAIGIVCAGIFGCILLLGKLKDVLLLKEKLNRFDEMVTAFVDGAGPVVLTAVTVLICAAVLMISYFFSTRIMQKKEF